MPSCRYKSIWLGVLLSGNFVPADLPACNVPVFRYALERWNPDPYVLVAYCDRAIAPEAQAALSQLQKAAETRSANVLVRQMDVAQNLPIPFRKLWETQAPGKLPWLVVRYPAQTGIEPSMWAGTVADGVVSNLLNSPARTEIARKLIGGDSAVWLLLDGNNQPRNEALAGLLASECRKLSQTLQLPVLGPDDPQIEPSLPLRVAFSTVRISRTDPAEEMLVHQLLNWHPGLTNEPGPILFPVFGRGRVLPPAINQGITVEVIDAMAQLLTGPCSCQIKEMNAGFDLLMAVDWGEAFQHQGPTPVKTGSVVGLTGLTPRALDRPQPELTAATGAAVKPGSRARSPWSGDHLIRNLAVVTFVTFLFLGITTILLRAKPERAPD